MTFHDLSFMYNDEIVANRIDICKLSFSKTLNIPYQTLHRSEKRPFQCRSGKESKLGGIAEIEADRGVR